MPTHCEAGCRRHVVTHWWHTEKDLDLWLCDKCSDHHAEALVRQYWALLFDQRIEDVYPRTVPA